MEERTMVRTKQELVNLLTEKNGLSRKKNMNFVNTLVDLINTALKDEKLLKISGLGTFKVIDIKDRESVNVQTGTRFVIEGRNKITFSPDNAMKELVNRPFSQFETVILNDGVEFKDIPETVEEETQESEVQESVVETPITPLMSAEETPVVEESPVTEEPLVVEETPATEETPVVEEQPESIEEGTSMTVISNTTVEEVTSPINEESRPIEEVPTEEVVAEETVVEEPAAEEPSGEELAKEEASREEPVAEESAEDESTEDVVEEPAEPGDDDNDNNIIPEETKMEENKSNTGKWLVALLLFTAAGFAGGFFFGKKYAPVKYIPMEKTEMIQGELVDSTAMDSISESDSIQKAKDAKIKAKVDSITRAHEARNESVRLARQNRAVEASAKKVEAPAAKTAPQQTAQTAKAEAKPVALPKGDNSKALATAKQMVNTGAYTIVGTQETITVKAGQNMKKISKFYLGDGMECYIQAYNGVSEVTEGMRLKIPKLQVKKKK
jgi:nucleoid DNA-binding protein